MLRPSHFSPLVLLLAATGAVAAPKAAKKLVPVAPVAVAPNPVETTAEGRALLAVWASEKYAWTPRVSDAYLAFSKAQALKAIATTGQKIPADLLAWVDSVPEVALTVYGAAPDHAADRLRLLRSLEIDLGKETVRTKYTQLALAMTVARTNEGATADLADRKPLELKIPGDARVIVDTHPKNRPLDANDHIINFLMDHAPLPDDGRARKVDFPELVYDEHGVAVPASQAKPATPVDPAAPKTRPLFAADVIEKPELEKEFNDYMAKHGQSVRVDCGEKRLAWNSHDCDGVNQRGVKAAFDLFLGAYKAKGYFPAEPDTAPTAAQSLAYYRMIAEYTPPPGGRAAPVRFPFATAPWPVMTFLASDNQSLRVRADMWDRWRLKGEFHGYGEYIGKIAQNPPMLRARRLTPSEFNYDTVQMMLKDGGVCGTMANISVRNQMCLGAPSSTAGQPGHCALVSFRRNADGTYACVGGQYATAGDSGTGVHRPFVFDGGTHRKMYAHQSVAYAVNAGERAFLETLVARSFVLSLPAKERKAHELDTLLGALALNPYSLPVIEAARNAASTPAELVRVGETHAAALKTFDGKPGCPQACLMLSTVRDEFYDRLGKLPVSGERAQNAKVYDFLKSDNCPVAKLTTDYQLAAEGEAGQKALVEKLTADFTAHLAGQRTPALCVAMAERLQALAGSKCAPSAKTACLKDFKARISGHEKYTYNVKKKRVNVATEAEDECAAVLAKVAA